MKKTDPAAGTVLHYSIVLIFTLFQLPGLTSSSLSQTRTKPEVISNKNASLTGVITDSSMNKPVEAANFILYRLADSTVFNGVFSDSSGRFVLKHIPPGQYSAKVSAMGYKSRKRNKITISQDSQVLNLDTIKLSQRTLSTATVNVTAEKEKLIYEQDKITVNIDRSMGNNAIEVLENTPLVSADIDGNISLMGRKAPLILIDGIPAKYSGIEKPEDLRSIPSGQIEKIELIIDPLAEYPERSDGGIINIITKKVLNTKYSGYAGVNGDTKDHYLASAGFTYGYKGFSAKTGYSGNISNNRRSNLLYKDVTLNNAESHIEQSADTENKSAADFLNFNLTWVPDKSSVYSALVTINERTSDNNRLLQNHIISNEANSSSDYISRNLSGTDQLFRTYGLTYNRQFTQKGRSLMAALYYSNNSLENENKSVTQYPAYPDLSSAQSSNSSNQNRYTKWLLNYNHPVNTVLRLYASYSGTDKRLTMNSRYLIPGNDQVPDYKPESVFQNRYNESKHNLQFNLSGMFGSINYGAGISAEIQKMANIENISGSSYASSFKTITPAFALGKKLFSGHSVSLRYMRMTSTPENRMLNPHTDYTDSTDIRSGNPGLRPYYSDILISTYELRSKDLFLSGELYYSRTRDIIEEITTQIDLRTAYTTYKNLAYSELMEASVFMSKSFDNWLRIEPEVTAYRRRYTGNISHDNYYGWGSALRSAISSGILKLQLDLRYKSPENSAQSRSKEVFYASAAAKLMLFDRQLSLTLRVNDIFSTLNQNQEIRGNGFHSVNNIRETTRVIALGISYYFQSKADDSIENTDGPEIYDGDF